MSQNDVDTEQSLALETAWQRYAQLETNASAALRRYLSLRGSVIVLSAIATLLAIITSYFGSSVITPFVDDVLRISLILIPIVGSVLLFFTNKLQQGQYWLVLSAGAEEIKKEIYLYRTLLQRQEKRHQWLAERVNAIQRRIVESVGGNLVLKPYTGEIPPQDCPEAQNSDPGFSDLLADDYLRYRLDVQLNWYSQELARLYATKTRWQIGIFVLSGLSALLPAIGSRFNIWVAFTTSLGTALIVWLELCNLDSLVNNYNQLILELNIIRDHWQSLSPEERNGAEFFQLVIATEKVLWSLHNQQITPMRQAVAELPSQSSDLLTQVINKPVPDAFDKALLQPMQADLKVLPAHIEIVVEEAPVVEVAKKKEKKPLKKGLPRAFVVMPWSKKRTGWGLDRF